MEVRWRKSVMNFRKQQSGKGEMNRAENEAYLGSTDTAPSTLDTFFHEDSEVTWRGSSLLYSQASGDERGTSVPFKSNNTSSSSVSIVDNITITSAQDWAFVDIGGSDSSNGRSVTGVGKAIGEKLDSWTPPSVSINPFNQGSPCVQCAAEDHETSSQKNCVEKSFSRYNVTLHPKDTITRILLGQEYLLECYRRLEDKLALLDAAVATMDSSAILETTLHLKKTVKKSLFIKEMQARPHASVLYVSYLKKHQGYPDAIDFLSSLGKTEDAAILSYELALSGETPQVRLKNMKKTLETNFTHPSLAFEAKMIEDNIKLLTRQLAIDGSDHIDQNNPVLVKYPRAANVAGRSLLTTLFYCCMYHWDVGENHVGSPMALRKAHRFTNRQLLWTVVRGRARVYHFPLPTELETWLGNKGLLGTLGSLTLAFGGSGKVGGSTLKSTLPVDQLVLSLVASGAPANVLAVYIGLVDPVDTRLKLAVSCKCHQAVVDVYVAQKNRNALEEYMKEIPEGSQEYLKAESALKSVRWKK